MPVPKSRDPELARTDLERWVARQLVDAADVRITRFDMPRAIGFSNETMLFDVEATVEGERRTLELVARIAPAAYTLFPDYDLTFQRRVIEALAPTSLPVPRVLWSGDAADSPFGREFFVMERIEGKAAQDLPPYTTEGWLFDASPEEQRRVFVEGMWQVVAVAEVDWKSLDLAFLVDPRYGEPGVDQELAYWGDFLRWVAGERTIGLLEDSYAWLLANRPSSGSLRLSWGDSRPGNILYRDFRPVAVLDWEMACLCPREADLAWWLMFQVAQAYGHGEPELPGFPGREEAIALYEELSGATVDDLHWWEVFSAFKLAVILLRLGDMLKLVGLWKEGRPRAEGPAFRTLEHIRSRR